MPLPGKRIVASLAMTAALSGCGRGQRQAALSARQELDTAVKPAAMVASLRRSSGAHWHATAMFRVSPAGADGKEAITTTTDLWLDRQGNFRLVESNDQDGGREVVRVGGELAVALRYGKMIRRAAQDPEPQRFLEEAVGQPFAAWDTVGHFVDIASTGNRVFQLHKSNRPGSPPAATTALRKWRETVVVDTLAGEAQLDANGALRAFSLRARFRATRDGTAIAGEIAVQANIDQTGTVAPVTMPAAEELAVRQRTVLEERALLTGLAGRVPPPAPPRKATPNRRAGSTPGKAAAAKKPATTSKTTTSKKVTR